MKPQVKVGGERMGTRFPAPPFLQPGVRGPERAFSLPWQRTFPGRKYIYFLYRPIVIIPNLL